MLAVLVVLLMVVLGAALGRRMLRLAGVRFDSTAEAFCFSAVLGLGVFSLVLLAVGLLGLFRSGVARGAFLAAGCCLIPDVAGGVRAGFRAARAAGFPRFRVFEWVLAAMILASLACGLLASLAPPTSWDATTSHLKVPFRYLRAGGVVRLDDLHSNGPMNTAMLYVPAMLLGGDTAPAVLHFAFLVIGGLAVWAIGRRYLSRTGALVGAATYFLMPAVGVLGSQAVADLPLLACVVLAFGAFLRWWETERPGWAVLAAVYVGLAAGTKYTGLYAVVLFFLGVVARAVAAPGRRSRVLSHGATALLVAVVLGSPWYVRNAVLTGNPFYPVLAEFIPTRHASAALTGRVEVARPRAYPSDLRNFMLYPINQTFGFTRGIEAGVQRDAAPWSPGPLFLAMVPLVFFLRPVPTWARLAVATGLGAFVLITPQHPLFRYLLPFLAPCTLVVGRVFDVLGEWKWARRVLCVVLIGVFGLQLVPAAARAATRAKAALGLESRGAYLLRADDVYPMAAYAAEALPDGAKVLYVGLRLYHFLERFARRGLPVTMGMPVRQAVVDFPAFRTSAELHERLRQLGFTHVIVNEDVLERRAPYALHMLVPLIDRGGLVPLARKKRLVLYKVTPLPASAR